MSEAHPTVAILHFETERIPDPAGGLWGDAVRPRAMRFGWGDKLDVCDGCFVDDSGWLLFGTLVVVGTDDTEPVESVVWNSLPLGYVARIEWIVPPSIVAGLTARLERAREKEDAVRSERDVAVSAADEVEDGGA